MKDKLHTSINIIFYIATGVLIGVSISVMYVYKTTPSIVKWARTHQKETQWARDRYELMQKAANELYYDDEDKGITIVKPWIKEVHGDN